VTVAAAAVFLTRGVFERPPEDCSFQRPLAEQPFQFAHLALQDPVMNSRALLCPLFYGRGIRPVAVPAIRDKSDGWLEKPNKTAQVLRRLQVPASGRPLA
jgi:hypothetical protein